MPGRGMEKELATLMPRGSPRRGKGGKRKEEAGGGWATRGRTGAAGAISTVAPTVGLGVPPKEAIAKINNNNVHRLSLSTTQSPPPPPPPPPPQSITHTTTTTTSNS